MPRRSPSRRVIYGCVALRGRGDGRGHHHRRQRRGGTGTSLSAASPWETKGLIRDIGVPRNMIRYQRRILVTLSSKRETKIYHFIGEDEYYFLTHKQVTNFLFR